MHIHMYNIHILMFKFILLLHCCNFLLSDGFNTLLWIPSVCALPTGSTSTTACQHFLLIVTHHPIQSGNGKSHKDTKPRAGVGGDDKRLSLSQSFIIVLSDIQTRVLTDLFLPSLLRRLACRQDAIFIQHS